MEFYRRRASGPRGNGFSLRERAIGRHHAFADTGKRFHRVLRIIQGQLRDREIELLRLRVGFHLKRLDIVPTLSYKE